MNLPWWVGGSKKHTEGRTHTEFKLDTCSHRAEPVSWESLYFYVMRFFVEEKNSRGGTVRQ
jgi:hypothetical protein